MTYDEFQKKSIAIVDEGHSLLVSAPTGAGKTVIAEYAIEKALANHQGAIYTAPIKALSNQKFRDFKGRYGDQIGILTGDVSINPEAPILIMTTEIYRNTLFEESRRLERTSWVIFDEVHYLDDYERGTVWEEAIMFSPPHVRLLCLSATVPNIEQIAAWIQNILNHPIRVVVEKNRPVPLVHRFQCQGRIFEKPELLKREGFHGRDRWSSSIHERRRGFILPKARPNRVDALVRHLEGGQLLPAIYFTFGRRRTETLAWEVSQFNFLEEGERKRLLEEYNALCDRYHLREEASARELIHLLERGIAFHHAGMLPTLKEVIEQLFTKRLIKLIFTTETFALGINMPARSVVFDELRKFYGTHFANLRTRDFYQMAGRAGRRGMDERGFVYARVNPHEISFSEVQRILNGNPEPVESQFNTTYATLLNLYRKFKRELVQIYPQSLHYFQSRPKDRAKGFEVLNRKLDLLEDMGYLSSDRLSEKGEFASSLYGYELTLAEMHEEGFIDRLNELELLMVLSALVYEPRKGAHLPNLDRPILKLARTSEHFTRKIHRKETAFRIHPHSKSLHFHLARAMELWAKGADFQKMMRSSTVDEGEMVRYFRMVIQLLREIRDAKLATPELQENAERACQAINRDVIDAERQLRA